MFRRPLLLSLAAASVLALAVPMAQAQYPYRPYPVRSITFRPGCVTPIVVNYPTMPVLPVVNPAPQVPPAPPPPAQQAVPYFVKFKLFGAVQQQTFNDHEAAHEFEERLEALGVRSEVLHGQGVYAVRYSCPLWKVIEVADHEEAHELEEWLTSIGFDAYVKHVR